MFMTTTTTTGRGRSGEVTSRPTITGIGFREEITSMMEVALANLCMDRLVDLLRADVLERNEVAIIAVSRTDKDLRNAFVEPTAYSCASRQIMAGFAERAGTVC